ncbi:methyltransferase domain-containing protein [bacterium]|nr:methyltransferase domain-containing protein [bacterium]
MEFETLSESEFERFRNLIYRLSGIRVQPTKQVLVANRLRRRLKETGIATYEAYYRFLNSPEGRTEVANFLDAITTNETYFFRDPTQFEWLGGPFLDALVSDVAHGRHPKSLRIWSAASSSGEELYTIATVLREHAGRLGGWRIDLLGTDLSGGVLESARAGQYDQRALRLVEPKRRANFFRNLPTDATKWEVVPELKKMTRWKKHNLMFPLAAEEPFDVIFLKNVLIYFDNDSKEKVLRNVLAALRPGGYLVVGPTDAVAKFLEGTTRERPWLFRK